MALSLTAGLALAGCSAKQTHVLGVAPAAQRTETVRSLTQSPASAKVSVQGEMIEKCPVAGCWFILRDKTGTVRVDTKAAGFVVSSVPLHTQMTVSGTVVPGTQPSLAATGVRY